MHKPICFLLALSLLLILAACGGQGSGAVSSVPGSVSTPAPEVPQETPKDTPETTSSEAAPKVPPESTPSEAAPETQSAAPAEPTPPDRDPIGEPAVIDYPELADEELTTSPLYRQALERPSVIIYQGEVLTDPRPVHDFLAAVEEKKDWDLYVYSFQHWPQNNDSYVCHFQHFISQQGRVTFGWAHEYNWDSLVETWSDAAVHPSLNEYGYLLYASNSSGVQVINDRAVYEDAEECLRLKETYIDPIFYTGIASSDGWASPQELGRWLWLFEDIYNYENGDNPWDRFGNDWPVDYMVETLSRYFDGVTADALINGGKYGSTRYDPKTNTIHYEGGRGGAPDPLRVTGWTREGDRLAVKYWFCDRETGAPFESSGGTLTIRLLEDGTFRYLSNWSK